MKIDRKFRKTLTEIPNDCKQLIEKLKNCTDNDQLLAEICSIKSWNIGKCELYHWADVLDRFNAILETSCVKQPTTASIDSSSTNTTTSTSSSSSSTTASSWWQLACDLNENAKLKMLLLAVLQFTALLIEHSYSRHLYNSIEHLTTLLESTDFHVILSVLNLLYVFSKRSIFINRLSSDKKQALLQRLIYFAESWGGKENGLDLVKCCLYTDLSNFPASATSVNFEYTADAGGSSSNNSSNSGGISNVNIGTNLISDHTPPVNSTTHHSHSNNNNNNNSNNNNNNNSNKISTTKHVKLEKVHLMHENPAVIMERVLKEHDIPEEKRVLLYTYIRLAHSFPNYEKRKLFVQTRLQSLSILVYSGAIQEHANNLLYDGLIEELVDVLTVKDTTVGTQPIPPFPEIKAASLKTLTAIIHLEKTNKLTEIIETTQAANYHGLLPTLVRKCVDHLIDSTKEPFPHQFATSLFSFLYHLATYDTGGDALVKCGIMETLLKVVNHNHNSQEFIMFVTRAVRVIDLITNLDMSSFEAHNGLTAFINRLEYEVNECRKEQPFVVKFRSVLANINNQNEANSSNNNEQSDILREEQNQNNEMAVQQTSEISSASNINQQSQQMETTNEQQSPPVDFEAMSSENADIEADMKNKKTGLTCYHQRSALLKSILNFFKKAIADSSNNNVPNLGDSIRHMMEGSLPNSLKHIISNADYYGPSLFLLATDVVQLFIFQEPSQLSQLQENGLTDVILYALLKKNVPATREVLGSLPTVFSALCLNQNGLDAFIQSKPFDKLFQVLLSPDYLPAMKRRRNTDQVNGNNINGASSSSSGTASQLGSAMDELMRHQPSLRVEAMNSIIKLLNQLIEMGKNPNYICQRQSSSSSSSSKSSNSMSRQQTTTNLPASANMVPTAASANSNVNTNQAQTSSTLNPTSSTAQSNSTDVQTANTAQTPSSDDENQMEDYENAIMMVDTNESSAQQDSKKSTNETTVPVPPPAPQQQIESIPLLDYITNIMKFVEAILSNNSTDDHCKEFVKQKGLVPLLQILSLPNLPIDFPNSAACQSVAQVCKAILHLAREPQVIDQALNCLAEALSKCESLYYSYINNSKTTPTQASTSLVDGSVLIRELAQAQNPLDACNWPLQTPLLHSISSIHSFIYLLITCGKINQNDVRNLTTSKWGSDLGVKVLKDLCKLYMNLIWESSMLLWLCNEEQQQQQLQQLHQIQQIQQLSQMQDFISQTANIHLSQIIQQLSTSTTNFEFNKNDLDRIKQYLIAHGHGASTSAISALAAATATTSAVNQLDATLGQNEKMDTAVTGVGDTSSTASTANLTSAPLPFPQVVQHQLQPIVSYSKLLRPLFNCSSKLGRSLCELFGLLVKLSAGSWKSTTTRRNIMPHMHPNSTPTQAAINVATAIADISISGFSNQRFQTTVTKSTQPDTGTGNGSLPSTSSDESNINLFDSPQVVNLHPKFRLTFYICSIGFTSSILFDEQKRPYHLMLQRFDQLGGLKSLFSAFYWSLSLLNNNNKMDSNETSSDDYQQLILNQDRDKLHEGTLEFIEAWLTLIQKLVNTKNMLETRHSLNPSAAGASSLTVYNNQANLANLQGDVKKVCSFDPIKFLFKIHKESFQALMCLWDNKSNIIRENYSLSETVLNILCQILIGDSQLQKKLAEQQAATANAQANVSVITGSSSTGRSNFLSNRDPRFAAMQSRFSDAQQQQQSLSAATSMNTDSIPVIPTVATTATPSPATGAATRQLTPLDNELIMQMISMGFSAELAHEAVSRSPPDSLEQAVEYCFNHPNPSTSSTSSTTAPAATEVTGTAVTSNTLEETTSISSSTHEPATPVIEISSGQTLSNIIDSFRNEIKRDDKSQDIKMEDNQSAASTSDDAEQIHQLDKVILDKFANNMLPGLTKILDNVPDTVYRVCDLVVVVAKKYGDQWRDNSLLYILNETCDLIKQVYDIYKEASTKQASKMTGKTGESTNIYGQIEQADINNAFIEQKLASRFLLFCLLFEEMQLPCSKIVNSSNLLDKLVSMLQMITIKKQAQGDSLISSAMVTPVWLTSLFILIDLIEKAALATKRKAAINEQFQNHQRAWKWYEERQNRWVPYASNNNKIIDNAYKNGETNVRIVASRKHYIIHFNTMLQENEETLHKRPVMLSFEKSPSNVVSLNQQSTSTSLFDGLASNIDNSSTIDASSTMPPPPPTSSSDTNSQNRPSSPLPTEVVNGLEPKQISSVIESCVELISWPVSDPDCLHAILRLILRLTRQYENAIEFAARRGPQHILNLTQRNSFMGYASLITLIFRHICEDEKNLRLTMEKAIRLALTGSQVNIAGLQPGGIGSRELHNVLRLLGPAICRHPDIFCEVACDILRIVIRREDEAIINSNSNINSLQVPIKQQLSNNTAYCLRTVVAKLMPPTPMPDYARELVIDLLNYLIKPVLDTSKSSNLVSTTKLVDANTTSVTSKHSKGFMQQTLNTPNPLQTGSNSAAPLATSQTQQEPQPLISKSGVLRILSELVRSYAGCAKIISQHIYKASDFGNLTNINSSIDQHQQTSTSSISLPTITEDCNALAFLLDNLLASNQTFGDKDCPSLCRLLIVALASCNHCLDSQNALVHEVKQALSRAINMPESNDKHIKIQAFASIINTMIETCPPIQNPTQLQQNGLRNQNQPPNTNLVNNMMKIMHKKGLINDLARVPLNMDLSCTKCIETLNTILKPLETMTKTLNISVRKRNDLMYSHKSHMHPTTATSRTTTSTATVPAITTGAITATTASGATSDVPSAISLEEGSSTQAIPSSSAQTISGTTATQGTVSTSTSGRAAFRRSGGLMSDQALRDHPQHSGVTSDVAGLNLASDTNIALADATGAISSEHAEEALISGGGEDEQMVDLNTTEMEPQQTLPQDVDMLPTTHHTHRHHHNRRDLDERVFDRVIEALNQDDSEDSDSEYESQNRIIHIEADNEGDQIHIQIETGEDEDDEEDDEEESDDEDEDAELGGISGGAAGHDHNSSGEDDDDEDNESNEEDDITRLPDSEAFNSNGNDENRSRGAGRSEVIDDNEDDEDSDSDDDDDDEDDEDEEDDDEDEDDNDDENVIDEEIVEGSDGHSANSDSDISEDDAHGGDRGMQSHHHHDERIAENRIRNSTDVVNTNEVDTTAVAAANGGVVVTTTNIDSSSVNGDSNTALRSSHRRRRHRHRREEALSPSSPNDEDIEDEDANEDEDEEDMELDDEDEDEIIDDNEIVEDDGDEDEDENGDDEDDEDEDDEDEEENDEDEDEDAASEYYDAYNQMLDFINDDTGENGEEDDFLAQIENLWQNNGNSNHIVLGHQLGIGNTTNRNYQINFLGGGNSVGGIGPGVDGTLPPHPLSVSAVHPLLVHHTDSTGSNLSLNGPALPSTTGGTNIQISGLGINASAIGGNGGGALSGLGSAISPILRTMRHHFQTQTQQQQQQQAPTLQIQPTRSLRLSRFVLPSVQLQLPVTANLQSQQPQIPGTATTGAAATLNMPLPTQLPAIRSTNLPYNTLNEILQGFETPASALQAPSAPSIITAPTATSFIDLLTGQTIAGQGAHHGGIGITHNHGHAIGGLGGLNNNNAATAVANAAATALSGLNNQEFLVNLNSYNNDGFGENIGNGTTNLYIIRTPLARWNEECTVLDSHSMHHAILLNKPKIMETLEKYRNEELNEKREKKLKEEKEKQKRNTTNTSGNSSNNNNNNLTSSTLNNNSDTNSSSVQPMSTTTVSSSEEANSNGDNNSNSIDPMVISSNNNPPTATETSVEAPEQPTEQANVQVEEERVPETIQSPVEPLSNTNQMEAEEAIPVLENATEQTQATSLPETTESVTSSSTTANPTFATQAEREAATSFLINFVGATCSIFTIATLEERRIAIEALRMADHHRASLELQAATADETNTIYPQNYVFLDGHVVEVPPGIDPSFLSALPDSLRREVIMEQLRILGIDIRNRPVPVTAANPTTTTTTTANTADNAGTTSIAQPTALVGGVTPASTSTASASAASIEINPEFLAALPPQIQEELLTQQRLEQQARAAASTTTENGANALATLPTAGDDDNTAFMRALPASLRQAILFDMDHSQISALPDDLATEARALQQQHREREIDLFAAAAHRASSRGGGGGGNPYLGSRYAISTNRGLGGIYNVASSLLHDSYLYSGGAGHGRDLNRLRRGLRQLNEADINLTTFNPLSSAYPGGPSGSGSGSMALEKSRNGRQLLDHESLASLLVLLFIDDPRMNMTKLHRVVRNLCIHSPTRAWVIKALLCILEKVSGKPDSTIVTGGQLMIQENSSSASEATSAKRSKLSGTKSPGVSSNNTNTVSTTASSPTPTTVACQPSWLTMSIDGPFGSKTNVFTIIKPLHKKSTSQSKLTPTDSGTTSHVSTISINTQACPAILKQILEILSTLARAANFNFFPRNPFPVKTATGHHVHHQSKSHFWDIIVKLDQSKNKSSKLSSQPMTPLSSQKITSAVGTSSTASESYGMYEFDNDLDFTVENSPLARLMSMLDYPVLKSNPHLMDKMFTCLSYASAGIPIIESAKAAANAAAAATSHTLTGMRTAFYNPALPSSAAPSSIEPTVDSKLPKEIQSKEMEPAFQDEELLNRQIELVVNVLKNKLCTQEGLQQAYTLLNNLSKINGATRNMIIKHLLRGTRELGLAVCREIEVLHEEAVKYIAANPPNQPGTSGSNVSNATNKSAINSTDETSMDTATSSSAQPNSIMAAYSIIPPSTSRNTTTQQNLIDSYSNLVISSPKTNQTGELQLPSMSILVEKNSNQKFFVRLIRLIINLRETIEKENKKKRNLLAAQNALNNPTSSTNANVATTSAAPAQVITSQIPTESEIVPTESTISTIPEMDDTVTPKSDIKVSSSPEPLNVIPELPRLSSELDLDILWNKLSACLTVLKSLSDPYAVLILQPTVEAFFYVHATRKDKDETKKREKETKETQLSHLDTESGPMSPAGPSTSAQTSSLTSLVAGGTSSLKQQEDDIAAIINSISSETSPDTKRFLEFALTHRTVLNHILRQTSNNLSEEPYSVLVDFTRLHTHILDFDVKRRYFRQELDKLKDSIRGDDLAVHVRRTHVFDDSYRELNRRSPDDWKHRFYIAFEGEEGQDAGGLLREWYMIISKEIFNPDYALFMINPGDRVTYMPNPSSHFNPNHLSYFRFIGHIIAKAIFDNKFLDCYFTRAFYKHILGVPVKYTDMESVDNEFYKNLVSILESDIDQLGVDLYFSIDINEFGVTQSRDLKSNGKNIKVDNESKNEYVRLVCQEKMIGSIRQQVSAFLQGFYEIIPKSLISIFNEQELELLISGLPEIDLEDLRRNTEYHKYTTNSLQIQWFWRALKSFDKEDQAKFLQFVTGTSKVPLQGFAKLEGMNGPQKFQIHRDDRDTSRLPCAHTCFNQLDLPAYENYEKLRTMMLMAIRECSTGFGLA